MNLEEILKKINNSSGVMLYFWGDNCNVCDALKPKIKEAFDANFPKIEQIYIDAKNNIDIAAHFSVFSIPTTIVFLDGKEFVREGRNLSISNLVNKVKRPYEIMFS
jgi:thioredoxin-like negative regulator of GroEL